MRRHRGTRRATHRAGRQTMRFGRCGNAVFLSSGPRVLGLGVSGGLDLGLGDSGEPFVYNCTTEEREADAEGSDDVVAFAFSPSGTYLAVTADNKQLILFRTSPWECLSVRHSVRRSTSLAITEAEDQIILADKSGDVYSFSILEPQKPGQLQLGHLSMLLAVAVSLKDQFVITADRDEKIRVSSLEQPYIIEAFCLGHSEFVSELCIPSDHPQLLVSGSGDGTIRLWHYLSGTELDCFKMSDVQASGCQKARCAVTRIVHCGQGDYFAVLCDGIFCNIRTNGKSKRQFEPRWRNSRTLSLETTTAVCTKCLWIIRPSISGRKSYECTKRRTKGHWS
ncbi:tRNA (guanine-N(7)-)-methyltransferase non-catalytic subunit wdr4 isoform X2 [Rhinoraja longicauda]